MARRLAVLAHHPAADPRSAPAATPPHLLHDEIPAFEEALARIGWEPRSFPVGGDLLEALRGLRELRPAVVVNLCEDLGGDSASEMHFAGALELIGLPYTGAPPLALGLCRDKVLTKRVAASLGLPTPASFRVRAGERWSADGLAWPLIVKPAEEDGSLGIGDDSVCRAPAGLATAVGRVLERHGPALVEEYVDGRELNVPVLGGRAPRALPVSEIDFSGLPPGYPRICGYEAKWATGDERYRGTAGVCPAAIAGELRALLERWSLLLVAELGLRGAARVDWRLAPGDRPFLLEVNPNPDLGTGAGFLRSLRAAGLGYEELAQALVEDALARRRCAR